MQTLRWKTQFFTIWAGQAVSLITSAILQMAIILYLTETTGSALVLSLASLVGFLPYAVLGPFIGVLVDRCNRKHIMILSDLVIALAAAILAFVARLGGAAGMAGDGNSLCTECGDGISYPDTFGGDTSSGAPRHACQVCRVQPGDPIGQPVAQSGTCSIPVYGLGSDSRHRLGHRRGCGCKHHCGFGEYSEAARAA